MWSITSTPARAFRNLFLIAFSVALLPLDLYLLMSAYVLQILLPFNRRRDARRKPAFVPKTILITGIATTKGVAMARMFYLAGHDVIGAETMTGYLWPWGGLSKAVRAFHPLPSPTASLHGGKVRSESYFAVVRWIIREHKVNCWMSCSEGVPAIFDAELAEMIAKDTICKPIHFDGKTTKALTSVDSLMEYLVSIGLPVPASHSVSSREQIHQVLKRGSSPAPKPYIIRKSNEDAKPRPVPERIRLPKRTVSETYEAVAKVPINATNPYVLQEEVTGKQYSTHSLVIANEVQIFVAFETSSTMSYEALPSDSVLAQAMLRYTQEFARRSRAQLTGHIAFTFVVAEHATEKGSVQLLFAIDCKPRVTTACVLLNGREREVASRYLQASSSRLSNGITSNPQPPVVPRAPQRFYWIGYDISTLLCRSIFMCLTFRMGVGQCIRNLATFVRHLLFWKEATFEVWDPLPSFWLYHVYWPAFLLWNIWGNR
jgi:catechol O-methyltransferase